jgi:RNA polymerase sigma factor (sigma-70 family)
VRLVVSIVRPYLGPNSVAGGALSMEDLVQEGSLGLLKAVGRFRPERGHRFSTYATWWIRTTVQRAVADQARTIRLPFGKSRMLSKAKRVYDTLIQRLGRKCVPTFAPPHTHARAFSSPPPRGLRRAACGVGMRDQPWARETSRLPGAPLAARVVYVALCIDSCACARAWCGGVRPTEEELAAELEVPLPQLRVLMQHWHGVGSLEAPITSRGPSAGSSARTSTLLDAYRSRPQQQRTPEDSVEVTLVSDCLKELLEHELSPIEAQVLSLRYGLDDGAALSWKQIAQQCDMPEKQLQLAQSRALRKLRKQRVRDNVRPLPERPPRRVLAQPGDGGGQPRRGQRGKKRGGEGRRKRLERSGGWRGLERARGAAVVAARRSPRRCAEHTVLAHAAMAYPLSARVLLARDDVAGVASAAALLRPRGLGAR